jgi:hypothetical protein
VRILLAVGRRPVLWPVALRQWRRALPRRWWKQRPFLPVPSASYVRFRLITQYGGDGGAQTKRQLAGDDVVHYLAWCRQQ